MNRENQIAPLAIASLALSCIGGVGSTIFVIPGIAFGLIAKNQISQEKYSGYGMAQAGVVVGLVVGGFKLLGFLVAYTHWFRELRMAVAGGDGDSQLILFGVFALVVLIMFGMVAGRSPSKADGAEGDQDPGA